MGHFVYPMALIVRVVPDAERRAGPGRRDVTSPVTVEGLVRTVAAMSPGGEWVAAHDLARRLHVQMPEIAKPLQAAIAQQRLVEQDMRDGIWWVRTPPSAEQAAVPERRAARRSAGQPGERVARPAKPPPPPRPQ
jgi:hypothetical protein